jgi:hypothetical protein
MSYKSILGAISWAIPSPRTLHFEERPRCEVTLSLFLLARITSAKLKCAGFIIFTSHGIETPGSRQDSIA